MKQGLGLKVNSKANLHRSQTAPQDTARVHIHTTGAQLGGKPVKIPDMIANRSQVGL